ncbi:MAG: hypothetical protein IT455_00505 [Planctomycetes bacterium]|nr:hypothetical protein [Planctomycetota bacterium]
MAMPRLAFALIAATSLLRAQAEPEQGEPLPLAIDSGVVANTNPAPAAYGLPEVVWSTVVAVPQASWLRLHYGGVLLSGARMPGADGSYLRLTSLLDGAVQTQHLLHVGQWRDTSAYFNGGAVLVELLACPGTGDNRLVLDEVTAGPALPVLPDSICGATDDRVLSSDSRVARNQPTGCTSWMISDCNHCFLTAGHCSSGLQVIEFNVPLSSASGSIQHPPPSDQYAVDLTSLQSNGGQGVGNDWAYFGVFPNSVTGLTPFQANGGQAFDLVTPPAVSGQTIRITGNGSTSSPVSPTWYLVQKTHSGPYVDFTGTRVQYAVDTTGGNSGSPIILDGTNQTIGIHTHAGCTSTGGANNGTASIHAGLQAALAAPAGVCDCPPMMFTFPNGQPQSVAPNGNSVLRVTITGGAGLQPSSVTLHAGIGGAFQAVPMALVSGTTFEANFPAFACGNAVQYYVSALDGAGVPHNEPANAPGSVHVTSATDALTTFRNYDFETAPPGWSVVNGGLTAGAWVRGTPADSRGPAADFDGSGQCWVTGNNNLEDVDGGITQLVTETVDVSQSAQAVVRFALWFGDSSSDDSLIVEASNDGGANWTVIETLAPFAGWQLHQFRVRDHFATPNQLAVRFSVADQPDNSVTEAAVDAFRIDNLTCIPASWVPFGYGCAGPGGTPTLSLVSPPALGGTLTLQIGNFGSGFPCMLVGLAMAIGPMPSPPFANLCTLYPRLDVIDFVPPAGSVANWSLPIPGNPSLQGLSLYTQAFVFDSIWSLSAPGIAQVRN